MKKFVYMDAAASWLKPKKVIKAEVDFLSKYYANAGRGVCARSVSVDEKIAQARETVAKFINTDSTNIVFTSGTTDGMNRILEILVKNGKVLSKKSSIAVSDLDHHSARLPWEKYCADNKCNLFICDLDKNLNIDITKIPKVDILIISAMSNVLGVGQDVEQIIKKAKSKNPKVITIVDAAQYVAHLPIDVHRWNCDFLCFSGHKIGADTGVGVMYIKQPDLFMPDKFGGGMVSQIYGPLSKDKKNLLLSYGVNRFEAGTLPLTQIIGLEQAIISYDNKDIGLIKYMYDNLVDNKKIQLLSSRDSKILSFAIKDMHVLDFGTLLGAYNICVRVGSMCASWIHKKLKLKGSVRISVGPWNTLSDAKYVINVINKLVK